jgi:SAM-dependent methyltransferase
MTPTLADLRHLRRLSRSLDGFVRVHLLRTGIHLGLFEALRTGHEAGELAERLGLARDLVASWLRAAHRAGLLTRNGGVYQAASFTRWLLDGADAPSLQALLDQMVLGYAPPLQDLDELMKGAVRPAFPGGVAARRVAAVSRLTEKRALAALLRVPGAESARRILDIGCGSGHYLAALLTRHRDAQAVGVEIDPEVADEARRTLREAGVQRRSEIRVGDFMTLDLPKAAFDLILMNNNLHYFAPAERPTLLRRAQDRLAPGGVLAIQTPVVPEGRLARLLGTGSLPAVLDLVLRAHRNLHGLAEPAELRAGLSATGFDETGEVSILPDGSALYLWARGGAATSRPAPSAGP